MTAARWALGLGTLARVAVADPVDPDDARRRATDAAARGTELAAAKRYGDGAAQYAIAVDVLEGAGLVHEAALDDADTKLAVKYYFAWAELERYSGNCACAVALYGDLARRFAAGSDTLRRSTEEASAQCPRAEPNRGSCRNMTAPAPAPTPIVPVVVAAPVAEVPAAWYRDGVGGTLAASGLISTIAASLLVRSSLRAADAAHASGLTYDQYAGFASDARRDRGLAIGAFALGGVLWGLAAWRYHAIRGQLSATVTADDRGVVFQSIARF